MTIKKTSKFLINNVVANSNFDKIQSVFLEWEFNKCAKNKSSKTL
jgi:hypothetical protein